MNVQVTIQLYVRSHATQKYQQRRQRWWPNRQLSTMAYSVTHKDFS